MMTLIVFIPAFKKSPFSKTNHGRLVAVGYLDCTLHLPMTRTAVLVSVKNIQKSVGTVLCLHALPVLLLLVLS